MSFVKFPDARSRTSPRPPDTHLCKKDSASTLKTARKPSFRCSRRPRWELLRTGPERLQKNVAFCKENRRPSAVWHSDSRRSSCRGRRMASYGVGLSRPGGPPAAVPTAEKSASNRTTVSRDRETIDFLPTLDPQEIRTPVARRWIDVALLRAGVYGWPTSSLEVLCRTNAPGGVAVGN